MGENDVQLMAAGRELAGYLFDRGLSPASSILDIGSGYGRLAIGLLDGLSFKGRYLGFDILQRHVAWCARALTTFAPNYRFVRVDIRNDRYNPGGRIDPTQVRFPATSGSFDMCAMISVCTHLYRPAIERYLREINRVLRRGGLAVTTWFLFDEERLPAVVSDEAAYPMRYVLDESTRYAKEDEPLRAIAYHERALREMAAHAALDVVSVEHGRWAGGDASHVQDIVVLRRGRRPVDLADRVGDAAWRLRRVGAAAHRRWSGRLGR